MRSDCPICAKVARGASNPFLIHEFKHSLWIVADHQYFAGYSQLILKHHARELHELDPQTQMELFREVMLAGQATHDAYHPWKMNYSSYGNQVEHIHWHVFPRYESDPDHQQHPWWNMSRFDQHRIGPEQARQVAAKLRAALK